MGVTGLWPILSDLCERKDLGYLAGKRVAVDLSGWVVQAIQCKALTVKNPHLRNLFFRTSHLLEVGAFPIFVLEGNVPDLKQAAIKERNNHKKFDCGNVSRSTFDRVLNQCHDLLKSLGVPCIKSCGEAEALCAVLCAKGVVDGVISEDSDTFLYGADTVFREFTSDPKDPHLRMYNLKSPKNKLCLNQRNLIALALLLGCDYIKGVPGIGKEAAINLMKELNDCDLLQRFLDWKLKEESELFPGYDAEVKKGAHCTRCSHSGTSSVHKKEGCSMCDSKIICYIDSKKPCTCTWHKINDIKLKHKLELKVYKASKYVPDFPSDKVIEEYLKFTDDVPEDDKLDWFCPNLKEFQDKALNYLNWTFENSFRKFFPIVTSWQQFKLIKNCQAHDTIFLYKPIKVLKPRTIKGENFLEIQWAPIDGDSSYDEDGKCLCSVENEERFKNSYPKIVEDFYKLLEEAKSLKKSKSPSKTKGKKSPPKDNRKVILEPESYAISSPALDKVNKSEMCMNPSTESYDSFLEIPLCERVKMVLACKLSECNATNTNYPESHVKSNIIDNNETSSAKDFCHNIFKDLNSLPNLLSNASIRNSSMLKAVGNFSNLPISSSALNVQTSISRDEFTKNHLCESSIDEKSLLCVEFSDSEDSYLDTLQTCNKTIHDTHGASSRKTQFLLNESLIKSPHFSAKLCFDNDNAGNKTYPLKNQSSFCNFSFQNETTSPKLIYSIKQNSLDTKKYIYTHSPLPTSMTNSTPNFIRKSLPRNLLNSSALNTPCVSNHPVSIQHFSPLIFNSSCENSIC